MVLVQETGSAVMYIESQADFAFTEFLAQVTPRKARRDLEGRLSSSERKLRDAVMAKQKTTKQHERNREIQLALQMARELTAMSQKAGQA